MLILTGEQIHTALLDRIDRLMDAEMATRDGTELNALASACEAYEKVMFPMDGDTDG